MVQDTIAYGLYRKASEAVAELQERKLEFCCEESVELDKAQAAIQAAWLEYVTQWDAINA